MHKLGPFTLRIVVFGLALATACAPHKTVSKTDKSVGPEAAKHDSVKPVVEEKPTTPTAPVAGDPVLVEFFVMSKCPFGVRVENDIIPVLAKMEGMVDFRLEYIGTEKNGQLTALHGETEVLGDTIQLCAAKYFPDRYLKLISCMNDNFRAIPEGWENCAKQNGLAVEPIDACFRGDEGKVLVRGSYMLSKERKARGSPTMFINGKIYRGSRGEKSFTREICRAFVAKQPKVCESIPAPVEVPLTILTDARCKDCRTDRWVPRFETMFPGVKIKIVDYETAEGKALYAQVVEHAKFLPVFLFGKEIEKTDNYERLRRRLLPVGELLIMRSMGKFDPTMEICDNGLDDTGNGKVDCKDPDCVQTFACRQEIPKKLEVFVMSQCPYAVKGLNAMRPVMQRLKNDIIFEVHYIAKAEGEGFRALHGQPEVEENIRQLCAIKHYSKNYKFLDYVWCRNENIRSAEWAACAGENGISTKKIETCSTSAEGQRLLREDIGLADKLKIYGSPTWVVNGRHKFNGIDEEVIMENFCKHNPDYTGCQ
ncbi:MAG: DsbA family protein [Deltaproteobacteria bacterium]|nr:DsbA family protein [Deltaproteobacteria bacterium]